MEDAESCCSRPVHFSPTLTREQKLKINVFDEVLRRLHDSDVEEAKLAGFEDELWAHFNRLPTRYALDVNVERAQDVLMHKRLLHLAHDRATRPAVEVRLVQSLKVSLLGQSTMQVHSASSSNLSRKADAQPSSYASKQRPMHEIAISTNDKPKLLSELTSTIDAIGLHIQEAHVFSTIDGYSFIVFLVDGWACEETERLRHALEKAIPWSEQQLRTSTSTSTSSPVVQYQYQ